MMAPHLPEFYARHHARPAWEALSEGAGFSNAGDWSGGAADLREASEALLARMVGDLDPPADLIDLGCGPGATTAWLARRFPEARITGVDPVEAALTRARRRVPRATFLQARADRIDRPAASQDLVISVEAAQHFPSRAAFLREARRLLRPGGHLSVVEMLFRHPPAGFGGDPEPCPDLEACQRLYREAGFTIVRCVDLTETSWRPYPAQLLRAAMRARLEGRISRAGYLHVERLARALRALPLSCYPWVLARAPLDRG